MPRIYVTPQQFLSYPPAITFAFQVQQLTNVAGMDGLMARASKRVDAYAKKRLISIPPTTVGTGGVSAGQSLLPVSSTLGFDEGFNEAVTIGSGGSQETIALTPGGVNTTSPAWPYPGILQLVSPVAYNHLAGETVQGCYQEIETVGSSSSRDALEQTWVQFDQGAQVAAAHAPYYGTGMLTRVAFVKCYPIVAVYKIENMLPFTSEYTPIDISRLGIQIGAGYIRLQLGSFVLPEGLLRVTYQAGLQNIPDDIKLATAYYAADELQNMVSRGAYDVQSGKTRYRYRDPQSQSTNYAKDAEAIIDKGNYRKRSGP